MSQSDVITAKRTVSGWLSAFIKKQLLYKLQQIERGHLTLFLGSEVHQFGHVEAQPKAEMTVHDDKFFMDLAFKGSVGAAESYALKRWDSCDLSAVIELFAVNRPLTDSMEGGLAWFKNQLMKVGHLLNRNSRQGSRKNIAEHYDLGNELFSQFLDQHMMYSSAVFVSAGETLDHASERKLSIICQKLDLKPDDHLLEIGTGWGGLAIYAARQYGCQVTTTTISEEQCAYARSQVQKNALDSQVVVLKEDYRTLTGQYDKIVSVEMIEAVGHHYLDTYTQKIGQLLKSDGLALIQAITIEDARYHDALKSVDFIKKHIFPGSFMPCISVIIQSFATTGTLKLVNMEDFGDSYSQTLKCWDKRFMQAAEDLGELGYDSYFQRMWHYYFHYCIGGFNARCISVVHLLLAAPDNNRDNILAYR